MARRHQDSGGCGRWRGCSGCMRVCVGAFRIRERIRRFFACDRCVGRDRGLLVRGWRFGDG
eukprot:3038858-Pleurochrysis_carterae.AAC.1